MTNKQWLSRGVKLRQEIDELNKLLNGLSKSTNYSDNAFESYKKQLINCIHTQGKVLQEIEQAIETVDNTAYRCILRERYLQGLPIKEIAKKQWYSERHLQKILKKATEAVKLP